MSKAVASTAHESTVLCQAWGWVVCFGNSIQQESADSPDAYMPLQLFDYFDFCSQGIRPPGPKRSRQCNTASQHVQQQLQQNTDTCSDESSKAAADALAAVLAAAPPPLAPSEAAAAAAEAVATSVCRTPGNTVVAQHTACAGVVAKEDEAAAAAEVSQAEEPTGTVTGGRDKHNSRSPDKADLGQQNTDSSAGMAEVGGVTAYVRSRPRREGAGSRIKSQLGSTSESLELVCCQDFYGPPGSGLPGSQPFAVEVDMQVGAGGHAALREYI